MTRHPKADTFRRKPVGPSEGHIPADSGAHALSQGRYGFPGYGPPTGSNVFIDRIYALLEQHLPDSALNVDWLAAQLTINRKTLYRRVQRRVHLSPTGLIREYRLRRAAELLSAGHTVSETAGVVGFKTPSHFMTVFKAFYRQTPRDFIASQLKNT